MRAIVVFLAVFLTLFLHPNAEQQNLASEVESLKSNLTTLWKVLIQFRYVMTENMEHIHAHQRELHGTLHKILYDHKRLSMKHGGMSTEHFHQDHHDDSDDHGEDNVTRGHHHHHEKQDHFEHHHPKLTFLHGHSGHRGKHAYRRRLFLHGDEYERAICKMRPNRAIPREKQQNVRGTIFLWQQKNHATLHIHVQVRGFNVSRHEHGEHAGAKSHQHGFHVHETSDFSNGCQSTGPHFNPTNAEKHGGPNSQIRHVGDLGNIACNKYGVTDMIFTDSVASLTGPHSIIGKPLVIHADPDDFGTNPHIPASLTSGNAGTRISCCIIEKIQDSSRQNHDND
ncbi:uncharacterized protein LOC143237418 [Tachypleus tridentatus]|uniref:uncharacterized protein LOC143237418 n=1 Tax=Tachypleus tridentatus TaxID=6853 RepID=UPI003FD35404